MAAILVLFSIENAAISIEIRAREVVDHAELDLVGPPGQRELGRAPVVTRNLSVNTPWKSSCGDDCLLYDNAI